MRHLHKGRRLNRSPSHLLALKRNMASSLFAHERICTTVAKAKELRSFAEKLITIAKRGAAALEASGGDPKSKEGATGRLQALHCRRQIVKALGQRRKVVHQDQTVDVVAKLLNDIGPRFKNRPGGYTRIIKQAKRRLGDGGETAFIELLPAG